MRRLGLGREGLPSAAVCWSTALVPEFNVANVMNLLLALGLSAVLSMASIPSVARAQCLPDCCPGDCTGDEIADELDLRILLLIALEQVPVSACARNGDLNGDGRVTIDEVQAAVHRALTGFCF